MFPYIGRYKVTSLQGMRTLNGKTAPHNGVDMVGLDSKNIYAVKGGTVVHSRIVSKSAGGSTWEWGNYVCIKDSNGLLWYYCHLKERKVVQGQTIKEGDLIGIEGNTGNSQGSHLHIELRSGAVPQTICNYVAIPKAVGTYEFKPNYSEFVKNKCGFEQQTVDYMNKYTYATDLWRKLWEAMR